MYANQVLNITNSTPSTTLSPSDYEAVQSGLNVFNVVWQSIYSFLTVFVNVVTLYVFIFKLKERTYSNMCFISLAFCDLVVGLVAFPATIYYNNVSNDFNFYLGIAISISEFAQPSIGFFILLQLTLHRIFQLTRPTKTTEKLTALRIVLLVGVWIVEYLGWLLVFVVCILTDNYDSATLYFDPPAIYVLLVDLIFYIIPVLANIAFIIALIVILIVRSHKKKKKLNYKCANATKSTRVDAVSTTPGSQTKSQPSRQASKFKISRDVKAVVFLSILIVIILITQSFYIITWPLSFYGYSIDPTLSIISGWLSYSNSLFNPIVLFFFHEPLKAKLKEMTTINFSSIFAKKSDC